MEFKVKRIHLTAVNNNKNNYEPKKGNTDAVVILENNKKYVASFFAYDNINVLQQKHQDNGNFLDGKYFWDKNMVLVEDCSLNIIEPVIKDLIDEGNFQEAFMEL